MAGFAERKTKGKRQDTHPLGGWGGSSKNELLGGVKIFYFCPFSLLFRCRVYTFRAKTLSLIRVNISSLTRLYTHRGAAS